MILRSLGLYELDAEGNTVFPDGSTYKIPEYNLDPTPRGIQDAVLGDDVKIYLDPLEYENGYGTPPGFDDAQTALDKYNKDLEQQTQDRTKDLIYTMTANPGTPTTGANSAPSKAPLLIAASVAAWFLFH